MTSEALRDLAEQVSRSRSEFQYVELKAAKQGCPSRLYDSISSFSNSDSGGVIIFGIDEDNGFQKCGVYDLQDLQKKVTEQCNSMCPTVRPLFSYYEFSEGKWICSVEIPSIDIAERPCYYSGKGRLSGSYVRVGTFDEHMTEYEIYSYEAYRKKYQDDIRQVPRITESTLNTSELKRYIELLKDNKPNLSRLEDKQIMELMGLTRDGEYTLVTALLFGIYPQAYFPQLCIIATAIPGRETGAVGKESERFIDNARIEGTIKEMLTQAIAFVRKNIRTKTVIDPNTGERSDIPEYPIDAVREVVLNALVHRDYSIHTEGMPIQLQIFSDRIEITNPGGLYGRISIDQLGKVQPDTRNPVLATALETLRITENRYSGIPTIRRVMKEAGLQPPKFENVRGTFKVVLPNQQIGDNKADLLPEDIIEFCQAPRTRRELAEFLGIRSVPYAIKTYITPLVDEGKLFLSNPSHPKSPGQRFFAKDSRDN